ncbi:UNVERIFIED_CONTAM: hypothetical protein Slati_2450800 [Sesamum latifolium]|uniref:Endonuclease/exonuclease/phosphatase domain-containing protein n=1 Tax=Sesamum latifolium TaxID=2727402 RepID=A0AAW2WDC9_9LAMI
MEDVGAEPWLVLGDFNTVLDHNEVCGHSGDIQTAMGDFRTFLTDTGLIPMPSQGAFFSWHNCSDGPRSLWKKLDRILANDRWFARWPNSSYLCATPRTSDHSPLVLRGSNARNSGTPVYSVTQKFKALKPKFRQQRKEKGDLMANVTQAKAFLQTIRQLLETDHSNDLLLLIERVARLVLLRATQLEQTQKIFHINSENGDNITEESGVANEFVRFYTTLFGGRRRDNHVNLMFLQPWARYIIPHDEGEIMIRPVEREEIKAAFFDIAEDKAPDQMDSLLVSLKQHGT